MLFRKYLFTIYLKYKSVVVDISVFRVFLSALFGAGLYHLIDKIKTRVVLLAALKSELETNKRSLMNEIRMIREQGDDWNGGIERVFHGEAYNAVRTREPTMFLKLVDGEVDIVDVYQTLFQYNELQTGLLESNSQGKPINRDVLLVHMMETYKKLEILLDTVEHISHTYRIISKLQLLI